MKSCAQLAYEAFASSFGIDIVQPNGRNATVTGPIPWESLPRGEKRRWANVSSAVEGEIARRQAAEHKRLVESDPDRPVRCACGARHLRGEKHICNDRLAAAG